MSISALMARTIASSSMQAIVGWANRENLALEQVRCFFWYIRSCERLRQASRTWGIVQLPPDDGHLNHPPRLEQPVALTGVKVRKAEIVRPIHYGVIVRGGPRGCLAG